MRGTAKVDRGEEVESLLWCENTLIPLLGLYHSSSCHIVTLFYDVGINIAVEISWMLNFG